MREASLVGTIRNEAEVIEALQEVISKAFTKKATCPNCGLNVRVRVHGLSDAGTKKEFEKCERLASFLVHNGLDFDGARFLVHNQCNAQSRSKDIRYFEWIREKILDIHKSRAKDIRYSFSCKSFLLNM